MSDGINVKLGFSYFLIFVLHIHFVTDENITDFIRQIQFTQMFRKCWYVGKLTYGRLHVILKDDIF